ncbi:Glycosyltransferase involved in cell wall bisynthesis [Paraburkholderia fungorum]|uniref:Glycosyltransferase involved in cell wall bisynthesis n=1 Tax=Paraburkholderia fungorum TaxID=134537 RepID=A0A1H1HFN5_9BURK|nr:glycosyltransferase [Paraburkholderia fungorum]SDR24179.1 Glycosyltransferase involved in cell wall bisynthesis [Paraburkholderia fungorum]
MDTSGASTTASTNTVAVSIIIPAYNAARYVEEAVRAMLVQSWSDFELLILDDGSTDDTWHIVQKLAQEDGRIRAVRNESNCGIVAALNRGMSLAAGRYIARMDADDYSPPHRLARQVAYFEAHEDVVVVGSNARYFGDKTGALKLPQSASAVRTRLLFDNPIVHSSVLMRKTWLIERGIRYRAKAVHSEDYDLWVQVVEAGGKIINLPDELLHYRVHSMSITRSKQEELEKTSGEIRRSQLARLGCRFTAEEIDILDTLMFKGRYSVTKSESVLLHSIYVKLLLLPIPVGALKRRYETGRFIASLFCRPRSLFDKVRLMLALGRIQPLTAAVFTVLFVFGEP